MSVLKTGLIGAGVFGGYHAGKIAASRQTDFVGVFDPDAARCAHLAETHATQAFEQEAALLSQSDAVIIASPAIYHADLVARALQAGCHVLIEKPLALTGVRAEALARRAEVMGKVLQVGHQERFVLDAMGLFDITERPLDIEAVRAGPPSPQGRAGDVSVIWDLMTHDFDMVAKLMGMPVRVEAEGRREHTGHLDEVVATLTYSSGSARLMASRCHPQRERHMRLTYPSGHIAIDFLSREIENTTGFVIQADISDRLPDPLGAADEAFFAACLGQCGVFISGHEAARAVHLAEQAELSALHTIGA